jgi:hypothetical protein
MPDIIDSTIESLVTARERGVSRREATELVRDVYAAPWSSDQSHSAFVRDLTDKVFSRPRPGSTRTAEARS